MPPVADLNAMQVRRRIERINEQLERAFPILWQERELLLRQQAILEKDQTACFQGITRTFEAICLCLDREQRALTSDEIFAMLQAGGWPMPKPVVFRGSMNDMLNYHAGLKTLVPAKPTLRRVDNQFGRVEWDDSFFLEDGS